MLYRKEDKYKIKFITMKNILILFLLIYCNTFEFIGVNLSFLGIEINNQTSFFNLVSQTNAQSLSREHQNTVCQKLKKADFNNDNVVDEADYSFLYLVAMKDQSALEQLHAKPALEELMDLTVQKLKDSKNKKLAQREKRNVDDQDVTLFYNYLTNNIPFCPYRDI